MIELKYSPFDRHTPSAPGLLSCSFGRYLPLAFARFLHSHSYFFFIFHPDYLLNRKSKTSISTANATSTTTLASIYELRNKILRACSFDRKLCEKSLGNMRSINRIDRLENNDLKDDRSIVFDTRYLKRNLMDRSKKITVARGDVSRGTRFSRESNAGMKSPSRASTSAADSIERNEPRRSICSIWSIRLIGSIGSKGSNRRR